jgi:hypothetical protein
LRFIDDLPQAKDANNIIVHFFDEHLGRAHHSGGRDITSEVENVIHLPTE